MRLVSRRQIIRRLGPAHYCRWSAHVAFFDVADTDPLKGQNHYAKGIPTEQVRSIEVLHGFHRAAIAEKASGGPIQPVCHRDGAR